MSDVAQLPPAGRNQQKRHVPSVAFRTGRPPGSGTARRSHPDLPSHGQAAHTTRSGSLRNGRGGAVEPTDCRSAATLRAHRSHAPQAAGRKTGHARRGIDFPRHRPTGVILRRRRRSTKCAAPGSRRQRRRRLGRDEVDPRGRPHGRHQPGRDGADPGRKPVAKIPRATAGRERTPFSLLLRTADRRHRDHLTSKGVDERQRRNLPHPGLPAGGAFPEDLD